MKPAAPRTSMLMWDNAYCVHELEDFVLFHGHSVPMREQLATPTWCDVSLHQQDHLPGAGIAWRGQRSQRGILQESAEHPDASATIR
ncbi:MAG: hypothetical protein ACLU38_05445 [Dysosmobacter sp.]